MVNVLVIVDGASEPRGDRATSLERASTPALDGLAATGELRRLPVTPPGLEPGSEAGIPTLLGWTPPAPVDRGAVEAAAYDIEVAAGERAWRVDVHDERGRRAARAQTMDAVNWLRAGAPAHRVHRLNGHRLLLVGAAPLPASAHADGLRVWPEGLVPPRELGPETVLVGARGAAVGVARLLGATTVVPDWATGQPNTNLGAKVDAALAAADAGARSVVVHVGGPDEAAHRRDRAAKVAAIERIDRELIAPLTEAVRARDGVLRVSPDHGTDPATGAHDAGPVPYLVWSARTAATTPVGFARFTERDAADSPLLALDDDREPA